jgi:hypothetical protein
LLQRFVGVYNHLSYTAQVLMAAYSASNKEPAAILRRDIREINQLDEPTTVRLIGYYKVRVNASKLVDLLAF